MNASVVGNDVKVADLGALPDGSIITVETVSTKHSMILRNDKRVQSIGGADFVVGVLILTQSKTLVKTRSRTQAVTRTLRVDGQFRVVDTTGGAAVYNSSTIRRIVVQP